MTRIDMTTREWHELIKPVLPHASTDKDLPERQVIRIEAGHDAVYAIAGDGFTLAAERHAALGCYPAEAPACIRAPEAAASLRLFGHSKDEDPLLHIVLDTVRVPAGTAGLRGTVGAMAVTITRDDGTRLAMHDQRDPDRDPLAAWRKTIYAALTRGPGRPLSGLDLRAETLGRWASAARRGERLCLYTGPEPGDPLLITVERHFAGVWAIPQYLDAPAKRLGESPWLPELAFADPETGEKQDGA